MKKRAGNFLLKGSIIFAVVICATLGARHFLASQTKENTAMHNEMITALASSHPHSSLDDEGQTFGRFLGTWECDYVNFNDDGKPERTRGEVIFGWVLQGRVVQDIWSWVDEDDPKDELKMGTTLRFFDSKNGKWQIVWISPAEGVVKRLAGGRVGDRIVLEGTADDGAALRWSFNDIEPESFVWRGEKSRDKGKSWKLTGEYQLRRKK